MGDKPNLSLFRFPKLIRAYVFSSPEAFNSVLSMTLRSEVDEIDTTGNTALSWAVMRGDYNTVESLLLCGSDPGHSNSEGQTPLHIAVSGCDIACVQLLLVAKADINARDILGATALHGAARVKNTKLIELLLSHGARIESQHNAGFRPLHEAVYNNVPANSQLLLDRDAKINATTKLGMTALMFGVMFNAHGTLKLLLPQGALKWCCEDSQGLSVLNYAALYGDLDTLHLLQSSRGMKAVHVKDNEALNCAIRRRDDNAAWSVWAIRPVDKDPLAWYSAFEALWNSIVEAR